MSVRSVSSCRSGQALLCGLVFCGFIAACGGPDIDIREVLALEDVTTGWYDVGIVDGKNKLVPTVAFALKNTGNERVKTVQLNAVFRRVDEEDEWGSAFTRGISTEGLEVGVSTVQIVLRSPLGYTGQHPRAEMFEHSQWIDARVELFTKHGSAQWVKLTEIRIDRQLLTRQ